MKKVLKYISFLIVPMVIGLSSCHDNAYYQVDPNNPSVGTPALLLTGVEISVFNIYPSSYSYMDRHLAYYERAAVEMAYNWGTSSFGNYNTIRNVMDMSNNGDDTYKALAKFFRSVLYAQMTETFGDIPYSESMKGNEGLATPKYDAQKDVYKGILKELDEANQMLTGKSGLITGDIIFNQGDGVMQWRKLINAYRLRLLIHLSKKESDADLNVKQQFQEIVSNSGKYPLMTSISDNGQIKYNTSALSNGYPTYQSLSLLTSISLEKHFVSMLKDYKDPRLFEFAEPISGRAAGVFDSYDGVDAGLTVANMQSTSGAASRIKVRYQNSQVNEPMVFMGHAEQEFIIAEGIMRGWTSGNAEEHYNNGIRSSMQFYGISSGTINDYLNGAGVKFDSKNWAIQIANQKYIAFFMNSGMEAFAEQRRTGIPTMAVGAGTSNGGKVPKRWLYPASEFTINKENVEDAVGRQYGGVDDINAVMWLLK